MRFKFECLCKFKIRFKTALEYKTGAKMGFSDEKTEAENLMLLFLKAGNIAKENVFTRSDLSLSLVLLALQMTTQKS
jgi:hypothetical protein